MTEKKNWKAVVESGEKVKTETVGDRVKVIRLGMGMFQKDFAKLLQMPQSNLSAVERNLRPLPKTALEILTKEGFSYNWIMEGNGNGVKFKLLKKQNETENPTSMTPKDQAKSEILSALDKLSLEDLLTVKGFILGLRKKK